MEHHPTLPMWWVTVSFSAWQNYECIIISGNNTVVKCLILVFAIHLRNSHGSYWSLGKVQPTDSYLGDAWQVEETSKEADLKPTLFSLFSEVKNENILYLLICNFWDVYLIVEHCFPRTPGAYHLREVLLLSTDCSRLSGHIAYVHTAIQVRFSTGCALCAPRLPGHV